MKPLSYDRQTLAFILLVFGLVFYVGAQTNPVEVAAALAANRGEAFIKVRGNYAYVVAATDGLLIYDISNPRNPVHLCDVASGWLHYQIAVSGNYAYLVGDRGLDICDISNPTNAVWVKRVNDSQCYDSPAWIDVSGNLDFSVQAAMVFAFMISLLRLTPSPSVM